MKLDALATERQFLDHVAPVWRALDPAIRSRFFTPAGMTQKMLGLWRLFT